MRKDVRMGFAVGGVLLAVIIVAVLVMHRNKNQGNKVALDLTGRSAPSDAGSDVDVATPQPSSGQNSSSPGQGGTPPAQQSRPGTEGNPAKSGDAERAAPDSTGGAADRWNQLFVSTAADPIKELATKNKPKVSDRSDDAADTKTPLADLRTDRDVTTSGVEPVVETRTVPSEPRQTTRPSNVSMPRTHRITQGETFVSIAKMIYGEERYFKAIERANPSINPSKLKPGVVIQLPGLEEVKQGGAKSSPGQGATRTLASAGPALSADGSTYTVQNGDNLYKISRKLYGNGSKEGELYTANKDKIGSDPTRLRIGMVLQVPEKPTIASSR